MAVRLYLDEHVDGLAGPRLAAAGGDVIGTHAAGMAGALDPDQLEYAANQGRVLVTFNARDFAPLAEWWHSGRSHAGILISRAYKRDEVGELLRLLENVLLLATDEDFANRVRHLKEFDV